ncbi:hypothetical protein pb186bvf_002097 [Paramecium bursaria]
MSLIFFNSQMINGNIFHLFQDQLEISIVEDSFNINQINIRIVNDEQFNMLYCFHQTIITIRNNGKIPSFQGQKFYTLIKELKCENGQLQCFKFEKITCVQAKI